MRKKNVLGFVLVLALLVTSLSIPVALSAPTEAMLNSAYKAYYEVLIDMTDKLGIGKSDSDNSLEPWGIPLPAPQGVLFAALVDFDNDGLPELLFTCKTGEDVGSFYGEYWFVYGYSEEGVVLYNSDWRGGDGGSVIFRIIVKDRNGISYILEQNHDGILGTVTDLDSFTVRNGQWVKVSTIDFNQVLFDSGVFFDNEDSVKSVLAVLQAGATPQAPAPQTVNPTASTVYLNGEAVAFEAYNIGGNNYFKLRDLAFVLNDTDKRFEVGYDSATRAIALTSGEPYTAVGGEMAQGDGTSKNAIPTPSTIYLDGEVLDLVVYNIGGNNFFKLRDLMAAIDVYVGYDSTTKAITLDTSRGYEPE